MSNPEPKPTCAVTGAGGYLGSCVRAFLEDHGWQVLELTRQPKPGRRAVAFQLGADLSPQALSGLSGLVHCAYDFGPVRWAEIEAVNVQGSRRLLKAARAAGLRRIAVISSISAFDGCRSLYGRAKLEIERAALEAGALVVRPGLIYGDRPGAMFGKLVAQVKQASLLPLVGGGRQIQHLVHHEDLAAFLQRHLSSQAPPPSRPLTAAHERGLTFRQILEALARASNKTLKFVPVPWRPVWLVMKTAELCRVRLAFRSDSLVSLNYQNPHPDFSPNAAAGLVCRPFQVETLKL